MERPNPFYRRSRISAKKFRQLLRLFALDLTATDVAHLTGLTRKSVTSIFLKIRERIAEECERASPFSACEVEVDESYFGARRVRGKRGRGASGKTIVFGLLKREGKVYTEIVPNCKKATLQAIVRGRVSPEAVINSDGRTGGAVMTASSMSATRNTSGLITGLMSSCVTRTTSTG
jgi:transposase